MPTPTLSIEERLDAIEAAIAAQPKPVTAPESHGIKIDALFAVVHRAIGGWASELLDEASAAAAVVAVPVEQPVEVVSAPVEQPVEATATDTAV
jgi:hypothetical protein